MSYSLCPLVQSRCCVDGYQMGVACVRIGHSQFGVGGFAMRFEKADKLLRLAMELQARRQGMTIEDIQAHFRTSRSTAVRMKGALEGVFPLEEAATHDDRRKRWRIPPGTLDRLA